MSSKRPAYIPQVGEFVLVQHCPLLPGVGKVIAFEGQRPVVQSLACPNLTVAIAARRCVAPERCRDPKHPDCLVSDELAIDCAQWTRTHLERRVLGPESLTSVRAT